MTLRLSDSIGQEMRGDGECLFGSSGWSGFFGAKSEINQINQTNQLSVVVAEDRAAGVLDPGLCRELVSWLHLMR